MNQGIAAGMTLLLASVSGLAVWQGEVHAAPLVAPLVVPAPAPEPMPAGLAPSPPWLTRVLRGEWSLEWQRSEHTMSLRLVWRAGDPAPVAAVDAR